MQPASAHRRFDLIVDVSAATTVQTMLSLACLTPPAIAPDLAQSLGLKAALVGVMVSIVYGGAMCTSLVVAAWIRRWGAGRVMQLSLALCGTGSLAIALGWLPAMGLGAFLVGLGYGLTNPSAAHLLTKARVRRFRNLIYSIKQTGVPLGGTLAGLMMPPLALGFGWRWSMFLLAALSAALCLALQPKRAQWDDDRDPRARLHENPLSGLGKIWRHATLRWLSLACFCFALVQLCLTTFLVSMLVGEVGMPLIKAGITLSGVQIAGIVGRVSWGAVADRLGDGFAVLTGLAVTMGLAAFAVSFLSAGWPPSAIWLLLLVFGVTAIGWNGVYLAEVAHSSPREDVGRATGASLFFNFGGVLVGPSGFALVYHAIGSYRGSYALTGLVALIGLGCITLARRNRRRAGS